MVAPAGPCDADRLARGVALLRERYLVEVGPDVGLAEGYLAAPDAVRLQGLLEALRDPAVEAVWCTRGGYGSARLLPGLRLPQGQPKPLIGFSDITALHLALQAAGRVTVHGPSVAGLAERPTAVLERMRHLLESPAPAPPLHGTATVVGGSATGPLLGGNLAVLASLLGTPHLPDFRGAVLLLEDVNEAPYRLDRMWTSLVLAGVLDVVAGVALGSVTRAGAPDPAGAAVLAGLAAARGLPCAAGFPVGHDPADLPIALGVRVRLDADAALLEPLEPAVAAT